MGAYQRVVYLPEDQGLAVATRDQGVVFLDPAGGRTSRPPIRRGARPPSRLAIDARGRRIVVGWADNAGVTVHDLATGAILGEFSDSPFAISPDGEWLAFARSDSQAQGLARAEVMLQRIGSDDPARLLGFHQKGAVLSLAFAPDGRTLGSTSWDKTSVLFDLAGGSQPVVLRGHREKVDAIAFSPDGGWVATASSDHTVRVWDVVTGQSLATPPGP